MKDGWETPLSSSCAEVLLPPRDEVPEGDPGAPPDPLPYAPARRAPPPLRSRPSSARPRTALEAVSRAEALLRQGDRRTAELLRRRLQALARHPDARVRCEAYRVLLLDDPLVDTGTILPAFLHSGLPFLSEESVAAIARADLGEERLTALRRRLHSYREAMTGPLPDGDAADARRRPRAPRGVRPPPSGRPRRRSRRARVVGDPGGRPGPRRGAPTRSSTLSASGTRRPPRPRRCSRPSPRAGASSASATVFRRRRSARLEGLLLGTSFLRESIELAFETDPPDLADIPDEGIWVTPVLALHRYRLYRLSVRTAAGAHHDLLLTVRGDLDSEAVRSTTLRMIALAGHPWGPPVVPRVGSWRPDLGALSLAWVDELTLAERLRDAAVPGRARPGEGHSVKSLVVRALAAFFTAWERSGRVLVPGAVAPSNVAVPAEDYREGRASSRSPARGRTRGRSTSSSRCSGTSSARRPPSRRASLRSSSPPGSSTPPSRRSARTGLAASSATCGRRPRQPATGALARAPRRGRRGPRDGPGRQGPRSPSRPPSPASRRGRRNAPAPRSPSGRRRPRPSSGSTASTRSARRRATALFRRTVFSRSSPEVLQAFDDLLAALRARSGARPSHLVELEGLHSALKSDEERHAFTRLVFPAARTSRPVEVTVVGDAVKHVVLATELVDRMDAAWTVRDPVDAAEVGRLYRLFVRAGLPRAFSADRRYLVVLDSGGADRGRRLVLPPRRRHRPARRPRRRSEPPRPRASPRPSWTTSARASPRSASRRCSPTSPSATSRSRASASTAASADSSAT